MQDTPIEIQMLGGFCIRLGQFRMEEQVKRAPKLWRLLQYLIAFRHKSITRDELIFAIWPNGTEGDTINAMRNMIFRVRSALVASGIPHAKEMILHGGGAYAWNNRLNCVVDSEEFDKLYKLSSSDGLPVQERLDMLLCAIELYKGDFLPNASNEIWVMALARYYRHAYFECVHTALEILMDQEQFRHAEMVCKKALLIDQLDEKIHKYHLRAMILQDRQTDALEECNKIKQLFRENSGVGLPESLDAICNELQQSRGDVVRPLDDLMREWIKSTGQSGALYCAYGMFQTVYRIEARSVTRSGQPVYIISYEVRQKSKNVNTNKGLDIMSQLYSAIRDSLRNGDVFTQHGSNQYIIMLYGLNYENCKMVSKKILRALNRKYRSYTINTTIRPIIPVQ